MNPYARLLAAIGGLPDTYLVIDVETNGMSVRDEITLPTQLGYLLVVDRKMEDCGAIIVNWAKVLPRHRIAEFWDKVRHTEQNMRSRGLVPKATADRIIAEGADPVEAWTAYHEILTTALARGLMIAGFNIFPFDCPLLARVSLQMDTELTFAPDRLLDFGLFEKAHVCALELPDPAVGPMAEWYDYARRAYSRGKWSLGGHCVKKYNLDADASLVHAADYDCWITHQLIEAHRALAEGTWQDSFPGGSTPMKSAS
jgi:hypothetical protein